MLGREELYRGATKPLDGVLAWQALLAGFAARPPEGR